MAIRVIMSQFSHQQHSYNCFPCRYEPPEGYVAVSHIVKKKKPTVRMALCWTPLKESFESIVEEDRYSASEDSPSKDSRMSDLGKSL